jgi:hypothetical protein
MKPASILRILLALVALAALTVGWMGYARYKGSSTVEVSDQRQSSLGSSSISSVPRITISWKNPMTVQQAMNLANYADVDPDSCTISVLRWSRWNWTRVEDCVAGFIYRVPFLRNILEDRLKGMAHEASADYVELFQTGSILSIQVEPGDSITLLTK